MTYKTRHTGSASRVATDLQQAAAFHSAAVVTAAAKFVAFATLGHAELLQKARDLAQLNRLKSAEQIML